VLYVTFRAETTGGWDYSMPYSVRICWSILVQFAAFFYAKEWAFQRHVKF